jgi:Spy/CpxP family protein refolding chaperone
MRAILLTLTALLIAAPLAAAQPQRQPKPRFEAGPRMEGWPEGEHRFGHRALRGVARYLDLSEDQIEQLAAMLAQNRERALPLFQGIRAQHRQVRELTVAPDPDPTAIGNLMLSIRSDREALERLHSEFLDDFKSILSAEQLTRYEALADGVGRRARHAFGALRLLPFEERPGMGGGPPGRFPGGRRGPPGESF